MEDERNQYLNAVRELIEDLERPNAYMALDLTPKTPSSEIQKAFMLKLVELTKTGHSKTLIADARKQLVDVQTRVELDTQTLDRDEWLHELDGLRNLYALFDFTEDVRGR